MSKAMLTKYVVLSACGFMLSACSKGGQLILEPGARVVKNKSSTNVSVNQGGKAMLVEQGKTPQTGVHGWATIQPIATRSAASADGHKVITNLPLKK